MTTLILGASENPMRFSNRAQKKLSQYGHRVLLVNPKGGEIDGVPVLPSLHDVTENVDTITVYINPNYLANEIKPMIELKPRRVIFNPGSESHDASQHLSNNGIQVVEDCTLLMLDGNRY